jgi:dihydrofolate reductase
MTTFIIAALSADGYIAKDEKHSAFWTSKEDKKRFIELTKRAGVVVMGSTTFTTLPRPLKDRVNIVYTRNKNYNKQIETLKGEGATGDIEVTSLPPADLLADLKNRGYKEVAICGGSKIYTMFMEARAVDKIYLTIEPVLFGKGIRLFDTDMTRHLTLISSETTPNGTVMLEYQVNHHGIPHPNEN